MFCQRMTRDRAQFEFSPHEIREIFDDMKYPSKTRSHSTHEFYAMLRAMLSEMELRPADEERE